ncbi:hypothetical protein F3Y22_tig00111542pilonHSYRG00168 [Hibiscus syriacus]|uniref:Uncharacterized protein n=1 Tax=Hibiscus syriacus TaxID=106335 RepID=A0A6A2XN34_HIBSY|nr:hypothetical protein F3Y22_tig00111542pilonHSYRG00168 [Hibiscus syriacus]
MEENFRNKSIESQNGYDLAVKDLRVLACDADINSLLYLCAVLVNCKYKVKHATNAAEAEGILKANKQGFDIVFVDVDTDSSDAFKLMETIGHVMQLPLIMVTGDLSPENKTKGLSHGAVDCIKKRPENEEIMNSVRRHFTRNKTIRDHQNQKRLRRSDSPTEDAPSDKDGKKKRMVWTPELDARFVKAVQTLGKKNMAHPMRILGMMNEPGLTREQVASHLQKYRISLNKAKAAKTKEQGCRLEPTSCRRRLDFDNFNADLGLPVNEVHSFNSSLGPTIGDMVMPSSGGSSVPFQSHDLHSCLGGQKPDVFHNYLLQTNVQPHNLELEAVFGATYQSPPPYVHGEVPVSYEYPYWFFKREAIAAYRHPPAVSSVSNHINGTKSSTLSTNLIIFITYSSFGISNYAEIANNVHNPVSGVTEPAMWNGTTISPSGTSSWLNSEPHNQVSFVDNNQINNGFTEESFDYCSFLNDDYLYGI